MNGGIDLSRAGHGEIETHGVRAFAGLREEEVTRYEGDLPVQRGLGGQFEAGLLKGIAGGKLDLLADIDERNAVAYILCIDG